MKNYCACAVLALLATSCASVGPGARKADLELVASVGSAEIPTGTTQTYTYRPTGSGPYPTVLYLQGYPCRSAAPQDPKNAARQRLVRRLVDAGFLVHIAEKPGLGSGESTVACQDMLYSQEVAAFDRVLSRLIESPDVDAQRVYVFGHSMGGQTAPLIVRDKPVRGIITYGIHAKPWFEFMIDISREQSERLGMDPVTAENDTRLVIPFLYDLMINRMSWEQLASKHADALAVGVFRPDGEYLNGRHYSFWADLNDASTLTAWSEFSGRVLAMYGEYDIASISAEGADRIAATVNFHHPGHATSVVIPKTGHGFATIDGELDEYLKLRFDPNWAGETEAGYFNDDVASAIVDWLVADGALGQGRQGVER